MTDYRVVIPKERFRVVEFQQDCLPGIAVINESLARFEPKLVFAWHLSVMLQFDDLIENGMPSTAERAIIDPFGELLGTMFRSDNPEKPNALFFARITWNKPENSSTAFTTRSLQINILPISSRLRHTQDTLTIASIPTQNGSLQNGT